MGLILGGALAGAGAFGAQLQRQWGAEQLEAMREEAADRRQSALLTAQQSMQQAGFGHAEKMEKDIRQPFVTSERVAGEAFKTGERKAEQTFRAGESELERTSRENMQIDRLALEEALGNERNAIDRQRVGIAGAQLKNDTERLKLERQIKEIQIKTANFDMKDKERFDGLKTKYLDPNTPDKERAAIADSMYALLGKDKYTAVVGKDEQGNPQFVGAFDTRSGILKKPDSAGGANRPPLSSFGPQGKKKQESDGTKTRGIIGAPAASVAPPQRTIAETGPSKVEMIERALKTPNLSTEQKAALALQLQEAMREAGQLGQ